MATLNWTTIQDNAAEFASKWRGTGYEKGESQSFWSDFLAIYGIDRKRHGAFFEYPLRKLSGHSGFIDMFWPGRLLVEQKTVGRDLDKAHTQAYGYLDALPDHDLPSHIVVCDFATFRLIDLETRSVVEIALEDLPMNVKLFAFLINQTSATLTEESPVNRKAAEAMAALHNDLQVDNYGGRDLELLLVRLVFCIFADDSGIFDHNVLYNYLYHYTNEDGSDLGPRLIQVFQTLDTPLVERQNSLDESLMTLPYVNGGLFRESIHSPNFSAKMRKTLLDTMTLDWSKVSPAIFGSMFQGVMDEKKRRNLGAHYTSEKNILKVIKPLFLDELYEEYAKARAAGPRKKYDELRTLQDKLANLKFLDPACGCGNFLVITYRELRKLEHKIVADLARQRNEHYDVSADMFAAAGEGAGTLKVNVDQMYGIEIEEFPSLIATTALWLTDHQMNVEYSAQSGTTFKRLPLTTSATIVNANALTTPWEDVIVPSELNYILGNPPFLGQTYQTKEQKQEVATVLGGIYKTGILDFVSAWYGKAADFMIKNPHIQTALVSTNSITQGEQVSLLWQYLLAKGVEINFAHRTFKWTNDAKGNAGVHCVIIGFATRSRQVKQLFNYTDINGDPIETTVKNINPYLIDAANILVTNHARPIDRSAPTMMNGSKATDGGHFLLSEEEKNYFISQSGEYERYIREYISAKEYLSSTHRYCLWLVDITPEDLRRLTLIKERVAMVAAFRDASDAMTTREYKRPTLFRQVTQPNSDYILVPSTSSEARQYIPLGFISKDVILSNASYAIPEASLYHLGVLSSRIHMDWMRIVAGRLKSDYRYSKDIVYNNFVWPKATDEQKADIASHAQAILDARDTHSGSTLADLYDPISMPRDLLKTHTNLNNAVERLYNIALNSTSEERVKVIFDLYKKAVTLARTDIP